MNGFHDVFAFCDLVFFIPAVFAIAHTDQAVAEMRTNSSPNVGRPL
jgi:hypothetical protein